jgi:hypothetical protein
MSKKPKRIETEEAAAGETESFIKDKNNPTTEEVVNLIEEINGKLLDGAGQLIILDAAFQNGIDESTDFLRAELAIRDNLHKSTEAIREALNLTYQVEW